MSRILIALCIVTAAAIPVCGCNSVSMGEQTIYVSPTGDDGNPGTQALPIQTLSHARELVRGLIPKADGDITVHLARGVYRQAATLQLDAGDSGAGGHDVIYTGDSGSPAIISGALPVAGWKRVDIAKNLWSAPAPAGLKNSRSLYVDGVRAWRTRGRLPVELTEAPIGYTTSSDTMAHWKNISDVEFVYTGGNGLWGEGSWGLGPWTEPRCPVGSIIGNTITMAQPCWDNSTRRVPLSPSFGSPRMANLVGPGSVGKQPEYVENAFELLGAPGQFYFDRPASLIYYVPRTGEDLTKADVEIPVLEKLIDAAGTESSPVHNIIFRNIQFSYATWLFPCSSEGFSEIQANFMVTGADGYSHQGLGELAPGGRFPFGDWTKTPGNVAFKNDRHIQFVNDAFVHLGAAGLELGDGSQNDLVQGCVFTDISGNGLELGGVDLPEGSANQITVDNRIADNYFHDLPVEFHGGVGIDVGYTQRSRIEHNQLSNLPYTGISIGWGGWPDKIKRPGIANNSQNMMVANNLIFDHMLLLADGGGIYTQGQTGPSLRDGEKVTGNVVRDQFSSGHAIYSDNGSANMTISHNVVFHTNFDNWGTAHANYYDGNNGTTKDPFIIEDNYWQQGAPDSDRDNVTMRGNRIIANLDGAPADILHNAGLESSYRNLLAAQFSKPAAPESPLRVGAVAGNGYALVTWNPPILEGSGPVVSYTITSSRGPQATLSESDYRQLGYANVKGLSSGQTCTFTVTATNAAGTSPPSLPSAAVAAGSRDALPPGEPVIIADYPGDGCVSIHFSSPDKVDRNQPITAYEFTVEPGGAKILETGRIPLTLSGKHTTFFVVGGLRNGQTYTVEVRALNSAGPGAAAKTRSFVPGP